MKGVGTVHQTACPYDCSAPVEALEKVNIHGTVNPCEAMLDEKTYRLIRWSNAGAYGQPYTSSSSHNPLNTPGDEPRATCPVKDYSITRWKQEQIVQRYGRKRGLRYTVILPAPPYGPGSDYRTGGIIIAISEGLVPFLPLDLRNYPMVTCHARDIGRAACFVSPRDETVG